MEMQGEQAECKKNMRDGGRKRRMLGKQGEYKEVYDKRRREGTSKDSNSEYNFAVGGFISYHRFNIKEEITWTKFYCTEIVRGYDDIILVTKSAADLKEMLEELDRISKEAGLSMNPEKTKLKTNASEDRIHLNGQPLEYVEDYTYLGQNLSFSSNSEKEIETNQYGTEEVLVSKVHTYSQIPEAKLKV
ncbi:hypothetical protein ANN_18187 [Periplaneta americana]|uniref:Reverse transcriptase domain-containing protein n=1 Tax=Periplaneta americana TaxID=6978 RepID=A0ABQ8SP76_PERAM|nr:hypothetical protein ANN_18187 [Periplaneta americana]